MRIVAFTLKEIQYNFSATLQRKINTAICQVAVNFGKVAIANNYLHKLEQP